MFGLGKKKPKPVDEPPAVDRTSELSNIFQTYADDDDPEVMSLDGIGRLGSDLGMDASSDVRVLVLLWKLGSGSKPGCLTRSEFNTGMTKLRAFSVADLRRQVPSYDTGFLEKDEFRAFYKFTFQFSREGTHKTIEKDMICGLLPIVLDAHRAPHLSHFLQFLETCSQTRITLDQWDSFLQFQDKVGVDLSDYEDDGAWPLLLDEYVEWRRGAKPSAKK